MTRAFLQPVRHRPNLTVLTHAHAAGDRRDARRRVARDRRRGSTRGRIRGRPVPARREVVLATGAIGSPQLLQLSGISPAALLQAHGDSGRPRRCPAWGRTCNDHLQVRMMYKIRNGKTLNERAVTVSPGGA